jgi:hypothetical protein
VGSPLNVASVRDHELTGKRFIFSCFDEANAGSSAHIMPLQFVTNRGFLMQLSPVRFEMIRQQSAGVGRPQSAVATRSQNLDESRFNLFVVW